MLTQANITESTWTVPLVALLVVGMLATFYTVVSDATKSGEIRRNANASQSAAVMRCNALLGGDQSKSCRKALDLQSSTAAPIALAVR